MRITCIPVVRWRKFAQPVPLPLSQKGKTFSVIIIAFSESAKKSGHFEKKDQLYNLNISEFSDSEKCGYLNARKVLFQNTFPESTCSLVLNTPDKTMEVLLRELSIDPTYIDLENVSVSEIWNLRSVS